MKTLVFVLCILAATAAFGQSGAIGSALTATPSVLEFSSHEAVAAQHPMAHEQNLLESSNYTWAQGERPLWEVAPVSHPTPLGDSARVLRKEHAAAKKAEITWNN
jgi:hypothetical protein